MAGLPMISLDDPKAGARELERCAKMGLKGAMIWCSPPESQRYSSDIYDPFWAAAQELKMPVSLHAITGMGMESQYNWGGRYMRATVLSHEVEKSFSVLMFSGVLDRFPELQIVSAENNIGWLPYYLQRMDRAFERQRTQPERRHRRRRAALPGLCQRPGQQVRRLQIPDRRLPQWRAGPPLGSR